jgi:UDP-N-acetylglucosamine diphosphorylase/glucosamine-1-phosphate N-acetyltransferase
MRWVVLAIFGVSAVAFETSDMVTRVFMLHELGRLYPSPTGVLVVFVALFAPRLTALWAAWGLGLLLDLAIPREQGLLVGPQALGLVFGTYFVLQVRNMVFRQRALTVAVLTLLCLVAAGLVDVGVLTIRSWFATTGSPSDHFRPLWALGQRGGIAVYSALLALPLGWLLVRTLPIWGFVIFDDGHGHLGPMTDLRASFELRTGMFTTAGRLAATYQGELAGYWVPARLERLVQERADAPVNRLPSEEIIRCVNGRWAMPDPALRLDVGEALVEKATGDVVAAVLRRADAQYLLGAGQLHERASVREHADRLLYRFPWDVIALMKQTIPMDILSTRLLEAKVPGEDVAVMGNHPVEVHASARIGPRVVFDAEAGPIIVHEGATIRPGAVICGPASVGRGSTVVDGALIKAHTVIGNRCKIGGEVGSTIFQGYANKAHHGHLGDSWVGRWVNFGAGTTNSNLLNTYGEVTMRVEPGDRVHRTGLTFLGAIVGDHAKFAINSSIGTGTVVGTGAMIAQSATPPKTVRRFAWLTDRGEQLHRWDKFIETARTVMGRRDREPSEAYVDTLRGLHPEGRESD